MTLKTNYKTITAFLVLSICFANTSNAQFWKKLKKKVQQKIENKVEKETDKKIDSLLDGKKKTKKTDKKEVVKDDPSKSYGKASVNHSTKYGSVSVKQLSKTKVIKKGVKFRFAGSWNTASGGDGFDGYYIDINTTSLDELKTGKTFKIPEEAAFKIAYDPIKKETYKGESSGEFQTYNLKSGTVTLTFNKDENVSISFNGKAILKTDAQYNKNTDEYNFKEIPAIVNGIINTTSPKYTITKEFKKVKKKNTQKTELTEADKKYMKEKLSPTVNIPATFKFNKAIAVEITDERGDKYPIEFLLGNYPDIWGFSAAPKEMKGQGTMLMVMTPKASIGFMNVAGMKMKKATSLDQMGGQYNMDDKIPDGADFEYKKTGNTKTILGYTCQEYKVDYNYTNSKGSVSFWVSKDFPIQNIELPMLGMKMNNPYLDGFVLEMNSSHQDKDFKIEVTNVTDKNVTINSNEYRKMGF